VKGSKIWKILWVSGIYAILLVILYLVVLYKVEWEDKDLNMYLYLYDCDHNLCTSTTELDDYYSRLLCEEDNCPYITSVLGNNLVLSNGTTSWIYNYISDEIVNDKYTNYRYIGHEMYVVTDDIGDQGVIDLTGNILVEPRYAYIDDYRDGFISYMKDNLYGIDTVDNQYTVDVKYEDVVLINNKIFAGMNNNIYHLYSYNDIDNENANKYNFVYAYDNVILVANNKKIDILNTNLNSTLLMKIDTFYEYTTEKERDSLDLYSDGEYIYFKVFTSEFEYTEYKYSIKNKKIV